jgi:uncharacterized protein YyaL (SSP411 family)
MREIVLVAHSKESAAALIGALHRQFVPRHVLIGILGDDQSRKFFGANLPAVAAMTAIEGKATAYVCQNYACQLPVSDERSLLELLK